ASPSQGRSSAPALGLPRRNWPLSRFGTLVAFQKGEPVQQPGQGMRLGGDEQRGLFMDFRWVTLITMWTVLSGPIFATPSSPSSAAQKPRVVAVKGVKPVSANHSPARK